MKSVLQTLNDASRHAGIQRNKNCIESSLSEVYRKNTARRLLPFVTTYHPAVKKLKQIVMENLGFIENQPLLKTIFKNPSIISQKRGKCLKEVFDIAMQPQKPQRESMQACLCSFLVGPSPPFGIGRLFTDYVRTFILSHPVRNPNNVHYNKYNNRKK